MLSILTERTLSQLLIMRQNLDGHGSLSVISSIADVLNNAGDDGDKYTEPKYREYVRDSLLVNVEFNVLTSMQPLTLGAAGHALSTIGNVMGRASDVSQASIELALDLVGKLLTEVITRVRRGDVIPILEDIKRHARSSVSGISAANAINAAETQAVVTRRALMGSLQPHRSMTEKQKRRAADAVQSRVSKLREIWSSDGSAGNKWAKMHVKDKLAATKDLVFDSQVGEISLRELNAATVSAMRVISTLNQLSVLDVAGNVEGQIPTMSSSAAFNMISAILENDELPSLSLGVKADARFFGPTATMSVPITPRVMANVIPEARLTFPAILPPTPSFTYEVQQAILYASPLPLSQTILSCIDSTNVETISSPLYLLPADSAGGLFIASLWTSRSFGSRPCIIIGSAVMIDVRVPLSTDKLNRMLDAHPLRIRLPFNPELHRERGMVDQLTGFSSIPSCVIWDDKAGQWTANGITHIGYNDYNLKVPSGSEGPYVECFSVQLGIFAVSEVPADCHGIAHGTTKFDYCGVCGGDNSTCSGCDGEPNTGRTKSCSGHGRCNGNLCRCEEGWQGVNCQIQCSRSNCSNAGQCIVNYTGMSFNSSIYCSCDDLYYQPSSELRCDLKEVYVYKMPDGLYYFLIVGLPILLCGVATAAAIYCLARGQALSVRKMRKDINQFAKTYEESNAAVEVEAMEVNADLCMPIMDGNQVQSRAMVSATEVVDSTSSSSGDLGEGREDSKQRTRRPLAKIKDQPPLPISNDRKQQEVRHSCVV